MREKYITALRISCEAEKLNADLVELLTSTLKKNPGTCQLKLALTSTEEHFSVELPSKGLNVGVSEELINALEQIPEVSYALG